VQALADLACGIRLEGATAAAASPFQALTVSAQALDASQQPLDSGKAALIRIEVALTLPVAADAAHPDELAKGVVLLHRASPGSRWRKATPKEIAAVSTPEGPRLLILLQPAWSGSTSFQVVLSGTGAAALLSDTPVPQPLAGVAGEFVPPGCGRDAHLFGTYTPPPPP